MGVERVPRTEANVTSLACTPPLSVRASKCGLTAGEATGKKIVIMVCDAATKAVEDQMIDVESYGHASAQVQIDYSAAELPANTTKVAGTVQTARDLGGQLDAAISTRATPAQVRTEVQNGLTVDTYAELAAVPAATSSLKDKIAWLFSLARNKITQTDALTLLRNDADSGNIAQSVTSDDGTTATRGKFT